VGEEEEGEEAVLWASILLSSHVAISSATCHV
jgi:hypothetical protein